MGKPEKPDCYTCAHRRENPGSAHSHCAHPSITNHAAALVTVMLGARAMSDASTRIHVTWNRHGWERGWFLWPLDYDPIWLESCTGYEGITR